MSKRARNVQDDENQVDQKKRPRLNLDLDLTQPDFSVVEESEVGLIEQVHLKNFMCHNIQDVKFGRQVNFIIGRNGSGKSAILTALVVGLGGKATVTNRGGSLKSFIKSGKLTAEVMVRLRNKGQDSFKPDIYGPSIIVKRKITHEGGSSYRIENSDGKMITNKREELNRILDQFNIQVDNPLVVLNQETSRSFLHTKSPHDKYKFFLKATQLEQMKSDYVNANESKESALAILDEKKHTMPDLEKEVFEWEQKYKAVMSLKDLKTKVLKLKDELIWAVIAEREKGLEPITKQLKVEEARKPKFCQKVAENEAELKACEARQKDIQHKLEHMSTDAQQLEPMFDVTRAELDQKKKTLKSLQVEVRQSQKDLLNMQHDREKVQERIAELQNSNQQNFDVERRAREDKIQTLKEQLQNLQGQKATTEHALGQFESAAQHGRQQQKKVKEEENEARDTVNKLQRKLQDLDSSRSNRMLRFGQWMPGLLQKIETLHSQNQFHQKPRGPIGAHLSLKDPKWALGVETCLKSLIHAFCCHDHHDERILEKLLRECCPEGRKPSTIVSQFQVPHTNDHPTVLDILDIEDPVVANCLIDQRTIESILLIENGAVAREVMIKKSIAKCKEVYTIAGDQALSQPSFIWYSASQKQATYLTRSVDEEITHIRQQLRQLNLELQDARKRADDHQKDIRSNEMEGRKTNTRLHRLRDQITKINLEITELSNIEDPVPVDIATLEEEIVRLDQQVAELSDKKDTADNKHKSHKENKDSVERRFNDIDAQMKSILEQTDPIKHELAKAEASVDQAKNHLKHYQVKMQELEQKIGDLQRRHDEYANDLNSNTQEAEKLSTRVRTRRTPGNIDSEIKQIQRQISSEEKNRGSHEEITRKYFETRDAFMKIRTDVNQLTTFLKALEGVMLHRQQQYTAFRRMIALRAKYFFIVMLSLRSYTGKMMFDHTKETLELHVQPTAGAESQQVAKDMRALSGGERSFSTVCFILSLWDAMESPFRCLDEFDVFMDMVNRRISMDLMMDVAKNQTSRQFIFLSPQDMSHINIDPSMVKILKMFPPQRGQTALPSYSADEENPDPDAEK